MSDFNQDSSNNASHRQKLVRAGSMHWLHWMVVAGSLLLTIGAWHFSKGQLAEKVQERFDREANRIVAAVQERLELYENALWSGVAFYDASDDVNYSEWVTYAQSLHIDQTYPGINGIGVIYHLPPADLDAFVATQKTERPDFHIHPKHDQPEHWPITFIEPAALNHKAIGLDLAFESNRRIAIQRARDTGTSQVTGPIVLVQDAKKTPGFLFYTPFYKNGSKPQTVQERRDNIEGIIYAPFIMENLMLGTLAQENRHVSLAISDESEVLYDDHQLANGIEREDNPLFRTHVSIPVHGRTWSVNIWSNPEFRAAAANSQPYMILAGGIGIDLLLLTLFLLLSKANRRALSYADRMTEDLRINTHHLEQSNKELEEFAYVASHDLRSPLEGVKKLAGWICSDNADLLPDKSKRHARQMEQRIVRMERLLDDLRQYSRSGAVHTETSTVDTGQLVRDVVKLQNLPDTFNVTVPHDMPTFVTAKVPLEQIMRNLISNAYKHHDRSDGNIRVNCWIEGQHYIFKVADDGPGIEPQFHEQIFKLFATLKPRDDVEGSGMGLAIIKKLVERYDGSISVASKIGEGTTFTFTWPLNMTTLADVRPFTKAA